MSRLVRIRAIMIMFFCWCSGCAALAQDFETDLRKEIEDLKKGQELIRKDLLEIKSLLSKGAAPQGPPQINIKGIEFELAGNPIMGSDKAKLTLIEFTDYQCPYCRRYVRDTFPQISKQYIDTGMIRYAVIDNPLPIHKLAGKAAEASHCASDQGKFWEIHELMMSKPDSIEDLSSYAAALHLDISQFENCLKTNKYQEEIGKDTSLSQKLGINGVPFFVVASMDPKNPTKAKGISVIRGAMPLASFQTELESALAQK
jgi:protein-disulfide isomerase